MKIVFLSVQPGKSDWLPAIQNEYVKKISQFFKTEVLFVKTSSRARSNATAKKKEESESLLSELQADDFVVLCDEAGKSLSSRQLASQLEVWLRSSKKRLVFVIGGAYGLSDELKARGNFKLSLSPL
ncbi:MAG: 23S rRNA (pseudouridine(1915)-N(3))-methyltransferase RlmH, partial [Bdellovibrionales bacterium]|nr:23S rRNA (pseudouridine(1915)-N(3))-methyltransferase RlmH [Bdellovibrionales bacterium]